MPPPPAPASASAAAAAAAASRAAMLHSVNTLASFNDTLADFLAQWDSVVLDAASIAATFAVLIPGPCSNPKPYLPAAEPQPQPTPAPEPDPTLAPQPDREPEPTFAPQPQPGPNAAPAPEPEPESQPRSEREPSPFPEPAPATQSSPVPEPVTATQSSPVPESAPASQPAPALNPDRERKYIGGDAAAAELESWCKQMDYRGVRRFVTAYLRDGGGEWLRQVGPGALRGAPDPAALVLRAVGRYYIRDESPDAEAACTLLLELYVRAGCPGLRGQGKDAELRLWQEVREAVLTWRCRLLRVSGAVGDAAGAAGARGLAFFMAAFGVPVEFPAQELCELVDAADVAACVEVLKASKLFVRKMRDVVIEMINKAMYLQAMRIILAFEFQEAFPLAPTLALIIEKLEHDTKDESEGQASERDEDDLALLSSISKCMEDHKLSPSEFTSLAAKIALLEERVGKPKQACTGVKRKRAEECAE